MFWKKQFASVQAFSLCAGVIVNTEFKKPRRRRRRQRRLKNKLIFSLDFIYESRGTLRSFTLFMSVKAIAKLNLGHIDKSEIKIWKTSRRGSRSPDNTEFGHFTFLFCRGRQRNVPGNHNSHAQLLFCSSNLGLDFRPRTAAGNRA